MTANNRALLVVEDSGDDAALVEVALRKTGFRNPFRVVGDPHEAVRYLKGEGMYADRDEYPFPHLIMLDHNMPVTAGW